MFLARRSTQAEYFDDLDRPAAQQEQFYRELSRINRLFRVALPFQVFVPRLLSEEACKELRILDLGAGDGSLGRELIPWARARGWNWSMTNLDLNLTALALGNGSARVGGSVLALPFRSDSFDLVIASQMTHHLRDEAEVVQHFREAWRVTREGLLICDLHRNPILLAVVWLATKCLGCSPEICVDGARSVARGFRVSEWRALARQAGIPQPQVHLYAGARIVLGARKRTG